MTYPAAGNGGDEELGAVGVRASVGHGEETGAVMSQLEVLICAFRLGAQRPCLSFRL
jgi:hypothetical protein